MSQKNMGIEVKSLDGGASEFIMVQHDEAGNIVLPTALVSGFNGSTLGVVDTADKRFVTDAELAGLQDVLAGSKNEFMKTIEGIDLNSDVAQVLLTVPVSNIFIPTRLIVRNASASVTTATFSVGFTPVGYGDVVADSGYSELVDSTLATVVAPKKGAKIGAAGDTLKLIANTLEGSALTVTIDLFGYYIPVA